MLAEIRHHLVGTLGLDEYYSAARFEEDALALLPDIWNNSDVAIVCGGSMMYVDALTYGIDSLPDIDPDVRRQAYAIMDEGGIKAVAEELRRLDPVYWSRVPRQPQTHDPCHRGQHAGRTPIFFTADRTPTRETVQDNTHSHRHGTR